jgi:hypothetical protein
MWWSARQLGSQINKHLASSYRHPTPYTHMHCLFPLLLSSRAITLYKHCIVFFTSYPVTQFCLTQSPWASAHQRESVCHYHLNFTFLPRTSIALTSRPIWAILTPGVKILFYLFYLSSLQVLPPLCPASRAIFTLPKQALPPALTLLALHTALCRLLPFHTFC